MRPACPRSAGAALLSLPLPAVGISAWGRPMTPVSACTLVVQPPRKRPIAWCERPLLCRT